MKTSHKYWILFSFLLHVALSHGLKSNCLKQQEDLAKFGKCQNTQKRFPCAEFCEVEKFIVGESNCSKAAHCCYIDDACYLKEPTSLSLTNTTSNLTDIGKRYLKAFYNQDIDARTYIQNTSPSLSPEEIQTLFPSVSICPKFPDSCFASYTSPNDLQPPINIPYCQRTPCQPMNPFLEIDPLQCLMVPGCAFDLELFMYRTTGGHSILPGVPLCHLAIRNEAFHSLANQYVNQSGEPWNPLLTDCFIDHHKDKILEENGECAMVRVIEDLGYNAKRAGWKGISSRHCYLINGCWKENSCVYPLSPNNFQVLSTKNLFPSLDPNPYGKPACLLFNSSLSDGDILNAYHSCLSAGCSADLDHKTILEHIHEVAKSYLPKFLQSQYWAMALLGLVRPDNWKEVADKIIRDNANSPFNLLNNFPTKFSQGSPSKGGVSILPFTLTLNLSGDSSLRDQFTTFGSFGQFGSNNPSQGGLNARELKVGGSSKSSANNLNLGNIGSIMNSQKIHSSEWKNIKSSLSGIDIEPSVEITAKSLLPCPYQPIQWPGYPPLFGSFEGCCDKPLCYISRLDIRSAHSEIASYITNWSSWEPCNKKCGIGQQTRRQFCIGKKCSKNVIKDTRPCLNPPCPSYLPWSPFTDCSVTCGRGSKTRTRICLGVGVCKGKASEIILCEKNVCPSRPSQWSECSSTCGLGVQKRSLSCEGSAYQCQTPQFETQACEVFCGHIRYLSSPCNKITCTITQVPQCITDDGSPGHCPSTQMVNKTKRCKKCKCKKIYIFCRHAGQG